MGVFFTEARTFSLWSISVPYVWYIHLVPRVVALACLPFSATRPPDGPLAISAPPLATLRLWTGRHDVHSRVVGLIVFSAAMLQLSFAIQIASPHEGISNPRHLVEVMIDRWIGRSAQCGLTLRSPACRADIVFFSVFVFALATSEVLALKMLACVYASLTTTFARFIGDSHRFDYTSLGDRHFDMPRLTIMW